MATAYQTLNYTQNTPPLTGHGFVRENTHLHVVSQTISTWAINDTILIGYLPAGAVVVGAVLKAGSQLDSNGAPTLAFHLGSVASPSLYKNAITTVGRVAGASVDIGTSINAAGYLSKTAAITPILVTVSAAAATPVAGTVEVDLEYYVEDAAGSNP